MDEKNIANYRAEYEMKLDDFKNSIENFDEKVKAFDERVTRIIEQHEDDYNELKEKMMHDGFYLEHTLGEKIAGIFDQIMIMSEKITKMEKQLENQEKRFNYNETILGSYDLRITKLENRMSS